MKKWLKSLWKGKRCDNRGLTLVELICTIAIFGVVCTAVGSVMVISARSYGRSTNEVNLQQESQLAANQIADLLIDATTEINYDQDTKVMTVKNGSAHYTVSLNSDNELSYTEALADGTVNTGVLAKNVKDFKMQAEDFTISGNARVFLSFEDESGRQYEAWYTVTARNGDVTGSAILENTATITTINEVTLEPNETYDLAAHTTVYGTVENKTVTWSSPQAGGATDPVTRVSDTGELKIGPNEMANSFTLTVSTNALDGVTPIDVKSVTVRVRRVRSIVMNGFLVSGTDKLANASYRVSPAVQGSNLARVFGVDYDDATHYKNPYYVHFDYYMSINGSDVNVWDYIEPTSLQINGDSNAPTVTFKLKANMPANGKLKVVATAKHPLGSDGGVQTNKTGLWYDNVVGEWILDGPTATNNPHTFPDGGLKRGTQRFAIGFSNPECPGGNLGILKANYGQGELITYWRYREVGSTYWTGWERFSEQGNDFAFQPASTLNLLSPDRSYEIEIESKLMGNGDQPYYGWQLWPKSNTPLEYYHSSFTIGKAYFSLKNNSIAMNDAIGAGTESNPIQVYRAEFKCPFTSMVAADSNYLQENMKAVIERKWNGSWTTEHVNASAQIAADLGDWTPETGWVNLGKGVNFNFMNAEPGEYRVTITWKDSSYMPYADSTSGLGIFYFKVNG